MPDKSGFPSGVRGAGAVRAWSDHGASAQLAAVEIVLTLIFFTCAILYARHTRSGV